MQTKRKLINNVKGYGSKEKQNYDSGSNKKCKELQLSQTRKHTQKNI